MRSQFVASMNSEKTREENELKFRSNSTNISNALKLKSFRINFIHQICLSKLTKAFGEGFDEKQMFHYHR